MIRWKKISYLFAQSLRTNVFAWDTDNLCRVFFFSKQNALEDNRKELAELLMQLIRQQEERQLDMKSLLHEMEAQRQEQAQDYWLIQYQRLMESMPESGEIAKHLAQSTPRQSVDIPSLKNENIMSDGQASASASAPSASASAPPISEVFTESSCVICLDSSVISVQIYSFYLHKTVSQELYNHNLMCITAIASLLFVFMMMKLIYSLLSVFICLLVNYISR